MNIEIDILKETPEWNDCGFDIDKAIVSAVKSAISGSDYADDLSDREMEISILLSGDSHIHELNRDYRQKDKPTNVLSFPQTDFEELDIFPGPVSFGDIALAFETIKREAEEQEKTFQNHLIHLTVHGTLHLMGYDHETTPEAEEMETLEKEILAKMGIENPYSDGSFMA